MGQGLPSPGMAPYTSVVLIGKVMILFLEKNHQALDAEDSWSAGDVGRYFFHAALGTEQMGGHLILSGAMHGAFQLLAM